MTAGSQITTKQHIGGGYYVFAVETRFGDVQWFVEDSCTPCDYDNTLSKIVRQCATYEEAIKDFIV